MATRFPADRLVYALRSAAGEAPVLTSGAGGVLDIYSDAGATMLALITTPGGSVISGSRVTVGVESLLPEWLDPANSVVLWAKVPGRSEVFRVEAIISDQVQRALLSASDGVPVVGLSLASGGTGPVRIWRPSEQEPTEEDGAIEGDIWFKKP